MLTTSLTATAMCPAVYYFRSGSGALLPRLVSGANLIRSPGLNVAEEVC